MSSATYDHLPVAPVAVISAVSCIGGVPSICDARVTRDNGLILMIYVGDGYALTADAVDGILDVLETAPDLLHIETSDYSKNVLVVSAERTCWDFSYLFPQPPQAGEGDSEESVEAHVALSHTRCEGR